MMLPPTVLCIDHSSAVLSALYGALRAVGYNAVTARDTAHAIRALAYVHFDAIIIDPHGVKLQSIADVLETFSPAAKVLLHSTVAVLGSCVADWGHAIVTKPAEPATVITALDFLLTEVGMALPKHDSTRLPLAVN